MWRTSCGERVLEDKEQSLLVHAAACLLDHLLEEASDDAPDPDFAWHTGVAQFDHLEPDARIVLLREVVQALTDPAAPAPELTAINEAAVHAVFRFVCDEIDSEIACAGDLLGLECQQDNLDPLLGYDPCYWRKLVLAAYHNGFRSAEGSEGDNESRPDQADDDLSEWRLRLECLADQILWDRDWELEEIMDAPPEQARVLKHRLGIVDDYFRATSAPSTDAAVQSAVAFLRRLADEDHGDREYVAVTLHYDYDGVVSLAFDDSDLERKHGFSCVSKDDFVHSASATVPVLLAVDVAKLLKRIEAAKRVGGSSVDSFQASKRASLCLHDHLPEASQQRFRATFEIARGISVTRDYGEASVEFDVGKFAGVELDAETREAVQEATDGLTSFLLNLAMNPEYDFADNVVRQALIETAQQLANEFSDTKEHRDADAPE